MADPIKKLIIDRLMAIAKPLQTDGKVRDLARKNTIFLEAAIKPALWLVCGAEAATVEDQRGYTLVFPAMWKITLDDPHGTYTAADQMAAFLQERIEADEQLLKDDGTGLCSKITYEGEQPFSEEISKPIGGTLLTYTIEYRRYRGKPDQSY